MRTDTFKKLSALGLSLAITLTTTPLFSLAEDIAVSENPPINVYGDNSYIVQSIITEFDDPAKTAVTDYGFRSSNMVEGDSATIENNALKITRGTTLADANNGALVEMPLSGTLQTADTYIVEYKMKVEASSLADMTPINLMGAMHTKRADGTMDYNNIYNYHTGNGSLSTILTKTDGTDGQLYPNHGKLNEIGVDGGWITVKYVVNTDYDNNPSTKDSRLSVYINNKKLADNENKRFKNAGGYDDVKALSGFIFSYQKGSTANSTPSAPVNILLDYVKIYAVNKIQIPTDNNYLVYDTFDNLPDGYIPTAGVDNWDCTYSVAKAGAGGSYTTNGMSGISGQMVQVKNGALRIDMTAQAGLSNRSSINMNRPINSAKAPSSGVYVLEYDLNPETASFYPTAFPCLNSNSNIGGQSIIQNIFYQHQYQTKRYLGPTYTLVDKVGKVDESTTSPTYGQIINNANANKWYSIKYVINMDTKLYDVYAYDKATGALINSFKKYQFNLIPGDAITLTTLNNLSLSVSETGTQPDNSVPGVYWVDNIKLYTVGAAGSINVSSMQPLNGAVKVPVSTKYNIIFDRALAEETVNSSNITVTKQDGTPVSGYTVAAKDYAGVKKDAEITFGTALDPMTTYFVTVTQAVAGLDGTTIEKPLVYSFTTAPTGIIYDDFDSYIGKQVSEVPGWTQTVAATGDSATVVNEDGAKSVKLVKTNAADSFIEVKRANTFTEPGKYAIEFSARAKGFSGAQLFDGFPIVNAQKAGTDISLPLGTSSSSGKYTLNYENGGTDKMDIIAMWGAYPWMWHTFKYVIDTNTDTFTVYVNNALVKDDMVTAIPINVEFANSGTKVDIDGLKDIVFRVKGSGSGTDTTFYMDNFAIYPVADDVSVVSSLPAKGDTNVDVSTNKLELAFSRELVASSISKDNFEIVSEDDVAIDISNIEYKLLNEQNRIAVLNIAPLTAGTIYTVKVKKGIMDMSGAALKNDYSYTFKTSGTKPAPIAINDTFDKTVNGLLPSGYTVDESSAGDSAAVENGMLKIVKSGGILNSALRVTRNNPIDTAGKKMIVEFNAKFENHSQLLDEFPIIESKTGDIAAWGYSEGNVYATKLADENTPVIENVTVDPAKWYNIKYVIDPATDKSDMYIDNTIVSERMNMPFPNSAVIDGIGNVVFTLRCSNAAGSNEVVWIDNLKILPIADDLTVTSVVPQNAAVDVAIDTTWKATFGRILNPLTTVKSNIEIKDANNLPVDFMVNLEADNQTVKVNFIKNLANNMTYTVTVKNGISDINSSKMAQDVVYTFTTGSKKPGTIVMDNFDGAENVVGSAPVGWNPYKVIADASDTTTVEVDPVTGSKALRIFKIDNAANTNKEIIIHRPFTGAEFGIFRYSYKIRLEKQSQYITSGGGISSGYKYDSAGAQKGTLSPVPVLSSGGQLLFKYENGTWDTIAAIANTKSDPNKYYKMEAIVNTMTDTYDLYVDGVLKKANMLFSDNKGGANVPATEVIDIDGFKQITFSIKNAPADAGKGDDIMWVDDVEVERLTTPQVIGTSPASGAVNVQLRPAFDIQFNSEIKPDMINTSNIKVLAGDVELPAADYNVNIISAAGDSTKAEITFNRDLDYKTTYSVKVLKAVTTNSQLPIAMAEDYVMSFTTKPLAFDVYNITLKNGSGLDVGSLNEVAGQKVYLNAMVKNNDLALPQPYALTIVLKSADGSLLSVQNQTGTLAKGESAPVAKEIFIPADATADYKVEIFTWSSYTNPKPLFDKLVRP